MSLLALPDEILINILGRLNTIDVLSVQNTCWRLNHIVIKRKFIRIEASNVFIGPNFANEPLLRMAVHPTFCLPGLTHKIVYNSSLNSTTVPAALEELLDKVKSAKAIYLTELCINEDLLNIIAEHSTITKNITELGLNKCTANDSDIRRLVDLLRPKTLAVSLGKNYQDNRRITYRGIRKIGDKFINYIEEQGAAKVSTHFFSERPTL